MAKTKKIECTIYRGHVTPDYAVIGAKNWAWCSIRIKDLRKSVPILTKGLRPGGSRKLILTQTKNGIKLERAKP